MFCYQLSDCVRSGATIGIAKYTQKNSERIHSHNFTEVVCILKGKAIHYVDDIPYSVQAGNVIYIKPGSSHIISLEEEVTYLDIYNGNHDCDDLAGVYTFNGSAFDYLKTILDSMYLEYVNAAPLYESILLNYYNILLDLLRRQAIIDLNNSATDITRKARQQMRMAQIIQEIAYLVRLNPQNAKSLQEVASQLHYSESYFSRKFTALFGISYTAYVNQQKFQHACRLIKRSNISIDDLIKICGIKDKTRFYRDFRKEFSTTPQQYRINLAKNKK